MDKKFLKEQMARIETNYGKERFRVSQPMFDLWYEMFADCETMGFKASVDKYIMTSDYPPTVAGIRKIYEELKANRKHLVSVINSNYRTAITWFEEQGDDETYSAFTNYVCRFPEDMRENKAKELACRVIAYCVNRDDNKMAKEQRISLKSFIERCAG